MIRTSCMFGAASALLAALAFAETPVSGADSGGFAIADFESPDCARLVSASGIRHSIDLSEGSAAQGKACLFLAPQSGRRAEGSEDSVTIRLPGTASMRTGRALSAWFCAAFSAEPLRLRWLMLDSAGKAIFQRRFFFDGGGVWHREEWPLSLWRWADERMGDWSEVAAVSLVVESKDWESIRIDDLRVEGGPGAGSALGKDWLLGIAFSGGKAAALEADGFLIATDAAGAGGEGFRPLLLKLEPLPAWIGRVFGKAVRPLAATRPVSLLVFEDRKAYVDFFRRLGTAWRVNISPPKAGGYTVFDIATSYYDPAKGFDRAVYFHEAVHAALARYLRLVPGTRSHSWLQECAANYLQLCLFPDSLEREAFVRNFSEPIRQDGKGFFKPLAVLFSERIGPNHYAQLASLMAFMVERKPDLPPAVARALAEGCDAAEAFSRAGAQIGALEKEWFDWGSARFKAEAPDRDTPHFPIPKEWGKK